MSDRMIPVPESALRALREGIPSTEAGERHWHAIDTLVACLPEPEPTFSDEEAMAFGRALGWVSDEDAIKMGSPSLIALAKAGWTAPKALCPPPSPALVEVVEAARDYAFGRSGGTYHRLRLAVAAYDEEE